MAASPNSFRDPAYGTIEQKVEAEVGLPRGMLATIRTRGERSNANQVSEAGAKSVYQVIPSTRAAILKQHGVDAYAGAEQAAKAAAILLKESLDRNNGNHAAAFAEYHGGTDRRGWGRRTRAYVQRTTGGGGQASAGGGTSFDRAKASRQQSTGPSMVSVYQAYRNTGKPGGMTPQDAAQYEHGVNDGHIMLPRGAALRTKPASPVLPKSVIEAYNSHRMDDDPEARAELDRAVAAGEVSLPRGMRLQKPNARTAGEYLGMGTRSVMEGVAAIPDIVAGPLNSLVNALPGEQGLTTTPFRDAASAGADALGFSKPESDSERLNDAIIQGGSGGLATAGVGIAGAGLKGATGAIASAVGANPVLDTVSGAVSGASSETARQAGAGPVGQVVAGLAGGFVPVGAAAATGRIRAPKSLPEVVADTPRAAVIDESGNLTPHGQEVAARHDVTPEQVRAAYEAPPAVKEGTANDQMPEATARVAGEPVAEPAPSAAAEAPTARAEPSELPPQPNAPNAGQPSPGAPEAPPATALARVQQANEFGFGMSKGMATKDFATQVEEQNLRKMDTPQGEAVRQWTAKNAEDIKTAAAKFVAAFDDPSVPAEQRGLEVQAAIHELHDAGKDGVRALYKVARELEGSDTPLPHDRVLDAADKLILETPMEQGSKDALERAMAKYGLLGDKVEDYGRYSSVVTDDGRKIRVLGKVEPLSLNNAEDFRQAMNAAYDKGTGLMGRAVKALDDTVDEAIEGLADGGAKTAAFKEARAAHRAVKETFESKDVVADIVGWKNGAENVTGKLSPEQVITRAFSKTSDLRRIKAVLLTKPTPKSRAMWRGLQAHGLATVFEKAIVENGNLAGEVAEVVSGAKLNSAVKAFGADKLKVLLDPEDFNSFMKLKRSIGDATIPISGTVPVGSAPWWQRLVGSVDNKVTAAFAAVGTVAGGPVGTAIGGGIGKAVGGAVEASSKAKAATATLKGITEYTPEAAASDTGAKAPSAAAKAGSAVKKASVTTLKAFIDTYGSPRILAPVLASTTGAAGND